MDVKGISWLGDVYQKFETLCLEVEGAVCQDTVKYVENQVQTVGASVKKFYSEVVEDLLSPSLTDPVKMNSFSCIGVHKKPKMGINNEPKKQVFEDGKATTKVYKSSIYPSSDDRFSNTDPAVPCNHASSSDVLSSNLAIVSKSMGGASKKLNLVIKRKPKRVIPKTTDPIAINPSNTPQGSSALTNENYEAPANQIFEHRRDPAVVSCGFKEAEARTGVGNQRNFKLGKTTDALVKPVNIVLTDGFVGCRPKEYVEERSFEMEWFNSMHLAETPGTLAYSLPTNISSGPNGEIDGWNLETITSDDDVGEDTEIAGMNFNKQVELGESVVIVDRENIPSDCDQETQELKHKSYKKKLRDAFSSRCNSMRKQEYKKLVAQYESTTNNIKLDQHNVGSSLHTCAQVCEPEWEIL